MNKEYLKMSDVFAVGMASASSSGIKVDPSFVSEPWNDGVTPDMYAHHAIIAHDELVEEIQWLRGELSAAEKVLEGVELVIEERIKNGACNLDDIADAVSQALDRINGYVD